MKTNRFKFSTLLMTVFAMAALLGIMAVPEPVSAQVAPTLVTLTNFPATLAGSASTNVNSFIPIYKDRGLALHAKFNAVSGSANVIYYLAPSVDGTNAPTTGWSTWTIPVNSTTDVIVTTNWSPAALAGYRAMVVTAWTNSATAAAIVTNKAIFYNIP